MDKYPEFRKEDIDLILCSNQDNDTKTVEIKADDYQKFSGVKKVFIETVSNDMKGSLGWAYSSSCNYFIFYYIKFNQYLIINRKMLVKFLKQILQDKYKEEVGRTYDNNQNILYMSHGLLIPDRDLIDYGAAKLYTSHIKYSDVKRELFPEEYF